MNHTFFGALRLYAGAAALALGVLTGCGGGSGSDATGAPVPVNGAPRATILLAGQVGAGSGDSDATTFIGSEVLLNGSNSTDPEGDSMTFKWSMVSKPIGSALELGTDSAVQLTMKPDVAGTYVVNLRVADTRGAFTDKRATILVGANSAPVTSVVISASYSAVPAVSATRSVTVGAAILLDGSGSRDADGDPVTTTWTLTDKPAASRTALVTDGKTARFNADVTGNYKVTARGTDPSGAYSETVYSFEALNNAPETVVLTTITNVAGAPTLATVQASVGYVVSLSGAGSTDPDGGTLTYKWTLLSKPPGSAVALSTASGVISQIAPDVLGDYVVELVTTDPSGAKGSFQTTVSVKNRRPLASISSNSTPVAQATGPTLRLPVNTTLTLRGTTSIDADGDALAYLWTMTGKPAASTAVLSGSSGATVQMTTDVAGSYQVRLRVTDPSGAYSEQVMNIDSGNHPPLAALDKTRLSVLAGAAATASGALSYDEDGDTLQYSWAIDARPAGSSAAIAAPATSQLAFTPDLPGTYVASLTVSDGKAASVAYLTIKALASTTTNVALNFVPLDSRYSRGLDKFVAIATNPNALFIIDPFTAVIRQVPLPLPVKAFSLSADGKLAAVLHEGIVSLVDIDSATLLRSSSTGGAHTEALVTNAGMVYLVGQTGGQWTNPAVAVVNGRTGADLTASLGLVYASFYGTQHGIYAASKHKAFVLSEGLSPADINYFTLDAASGAVIKSGDSPYHGDYAMSSPFYLTGNEDLLFTSNGNYFRTDTLQYAGKLTVSASLLSMSHSSSADEAIVLGGTVSFYPATRTYEASYRRFTGPLFLPDTNVTLPLIGGLQSYGIAIFHSANDNHVALVQTGSATQNGVGVSYYLTTR
jgi:hypothetical protein